MKQATIDLIQDIKMRHQIPAMVKFQKFSVEIFKSEVRDNGARLLIELIKKHFTIRNSDWKKPVKGMQKVILYISEE